MKIWTLGTGDSLPHAGRRGNTSLLVEDRGQLLLVDCSGYPGQAIVRLGFSLEQVTDVLLTHAHVDHLYALPSLVHARWLATYPREEQRLRVWGRPDVLQVATDLIDAFGLREKPSPVRVTFQQFSATSGTLNLGLKGSVEYFPVDHVGTQAVGFQFEDDENLCVFSGDTEPCHEVRARLRPGATLIHDCGSGETARSGHTSIEQLAALAAGTEIGRIVLTHMKDVDPESLSKIANLARRSLPGNVLLPEDGDLVWESSTE